MHTVWRDIVGFEGLYKVSTKGDVYNMVARRYMITHLTEKGYQFVCLFKGGVQRNCKVHRLVLEAFVFNPCNKSQSNHKDGCKINNDIENLEWATNSENQLHRHRVLGQKGGMLGKIGRLSKLSTPVNKYAQSGEFLEQYEGMMDAQRKTGIPNTNISKACHGERRIAGGFIWKFQDEGKPDTICGKSR
jgi:hypothetical protein